MSTEKTGITEKPCADYYIVEPVRLRNRTAEGIELPEGYMKDGRIGRVIAAGPGKLAIGQDGLPRASGMDPETNQPKLWCLPMRAKTGDIVIFTHEFNYLNAPGRPIRKVVNDQHIVAVLENVPLEDSEVIKGDVPNVVQAPAPLKIVNPRDN